MKLCVGMIAASESWTQLCQQEGIPHVVISLADDTFAERCSVIIVNKPLALAERGRLEEYLRYGGAIIGYTKHLEGVCGITGIPARLDYIVSAADDVIGGAGLIDLGTEGVVPREAHLLRTQDNTFAAFAGPLGGGCAVVLPFDMGQLLQDSRAANKSFYFARDRLPTERVSLVGKAELHRLFHCAMQYVHHARGLPYVHLWWFPDGQRNLFALRIDTDGAPQHDVDDLYAVARAHGVSLSWFLDVKSHESWLRHFTTFVDQEIGVHCYEHRTYESFGANQKNIQTAVHMVRAAGLQPTGFTAPFGIWNVELARAVDECALEYSSEFSYSYDGLPLYPADQDQRFGTLQVPVHPICIGAMKRVGHGDSHIVEYYRSVIEKKLAFGEPLFFYHHPAHHGWPVMEFLFDRMNHLGVNNVTLGAYARWWKKRLEMEVQFSLAGDVLRLENKAPAQDGSVYLHITVGGRGEAIMPMHESIAVNGLPFKERSGFHFPDDLTRIREFDPRSLLGDVFTSVVRKLR
jgi:hypothetical protein